MFSFYVYLIWRISLLKAYSISHSTRSLKTRWHRAHTDKNKNIVCVVGSRHQVAIRQFSILASLDNNVIVVEVIKRDAVWTKSATHLWKHGGQNPFYSKVGGRMNFPLKIMQGWRVGGRRGKIYICGVAVSGKTTTNVEI